MKALVYRRHGEPSDVLTYEDLAPPANPGPGEVSVRLTKRMVHPIDEMMIRGMFPTPIPDGGAIPGGDAVGIVEQVGAGGAASAGIVPGKRVMLFPMHGSWAERAVAPVATAMPVPDDISDATACQMIMNGFTATTLMRAALAAQSQAGLTGPLLVTAAGSSVGRNLIALAQMRGAKVVAVVRSDLGAAILRQGTAGVPVVSMERDGWAASVTAAYKQAPSVVIDPIGGGTMPMWLELMADRGTLLTYGGMDARPSTVSTVAVTSRQLTIRGVSAYGWAATASREQRAADMADVFEMARRAPQNFAGSCEFPLSKALQALSAAQASPRRGATILSSGS